MNSESDQYEKLLKDHLESVQDIELVFLKGHLVVEQLLTEFLELQLEEPDRLGKMNLMFNKKLEMYLSISGNSIISDGLERVLKDMNALRNKLAHNLRHPDFDDQLRSWVQEASQSKIPDPNNVAQFRHQLIDGISYIAGFLAGAICAAQAHNQSLKTGTPQSGAGGLPPNR